ncbi:MAG: hypothetical protein LBM60_06135 [Clostridium sp.]|jgi:ribosomal-protein-alanine N-acetyltransferase|nr:hypothetical protein [Clostridium sp.]
MRNYHAEPKSNLATVICNKCGKQLKVESGLLKEGCFSADVEFGYFSAKDGTRHRFDLCEDCYDELTSSMMVPVEIINQTEMV